MARISAITELFAAVAPDAAEVVAPTASCLLAIGGASYWIEAWAVIVQRRLRTRPHKPQRRDLKNDKRTHQRCQRTDQSV